MSGSTPASPTVSAAAGPVPGAKQVSLGMEAWRRFRRHRLALVGAVILGIMACAVLCGPCLYPVPINEIDFAAKLQGPSWKHPFGTDDLGQDLLARMIYGGGRSRAVGGVGVRCAPVAGGVRADSGGV